MQIAMLRKPAFRVQNTKKGWKKKQNTTTPGVRNTVRASPCQVFVGRGWLRNPGLPRGRPCSIGSARPLPPTPLGCVAPEQQPQGCGSEKLGFGGAESPAQLCPRQPPSSR